MLTIEALYLVTETTIYYILEIILLHNQ